MLLTGWPASHAPPRSMTRLPVGFRTRQNSSAKGRNQSTYDSWLSLPYSLGRWRAKGGEVRMRSTDSSGRWSSSVSTDSPTHACPRDVAYAREGSAVRSIGGTCGSYESDRTPDENIGASGWFAGSAWRN